MRLSPHNNKRLPSLAILLGLILSAWYLYHNLGANLARQSITTGFEFLDREAGFEIGESLISYTAGNTYGRALVVGFLNTFKAGAAGILVALCLGVAVGIGRLSSHHMVSFASACYVEILRNVPALLQLFFWYALLNSLLPPPRQALNPCWGVFLSNRGIMVPGLDLTPPVLSGFNFTGGTVLTLEFTALVMGLGVYTSAFVAETVRAGICSVAKGQWEAGKALGLRPWAIFHTIVFPQALRVIIPPVTGLMLGLVKNSSLAVAIGYPDFLCVANTTINQTGQVLEGVVMIMTVYLALSLATSVAMKWFDPGRSTDAP